jgi:nitrate reductase gamma subunit
MKKAPLMILLISGLCLQSTGIFLASKASAFIYLGVLGSMLIFFSVYKLFIQRV